MSNKCTDPQLGALLHAYEIGILSEEDRNKFEIHLLRCEFCFSKVTRFAPQAAALRTDEEVILETRKAVETSDTEKEKAGFWRTYFWPEKPLILKPAVALIIILILLYPAYRGVFQSPGSDIHPVQSISFDTFRSGSPISTAKIKKDVIVSFVVDDISSETAYVVTIKNQKGRVIYQNNYYSGYDKYGVGYLFIPKELATPGQYTLSISITDGDDTLNTQKYNFTI